MQKHLFFWGLIFLCFPFLYAQKTIDLRGKVTDENGEPLLGVSVILKGSLKGAATDEKGFYQLQHIPLGKQTFIFSSIGYQTLSKEIEVMPNPSGTHLHLNVSLQEEAEVLQEVEIIGRKESSYKNTSS